MFNYSQVVFAVVRCKTLHHHWISLDVVSAPLIVNLIPYFLNTYSQVFICLFCILFQTLEFNTQKLFQIICDVILWPSRSHKGINPIRKLSERAPAESVECVQERCPTHP